MLSEERKILVVDDDHGNADAIVRYFQDQPFRILYAPNGMLGYEAAVKELPHLIIMDWAMPMMNGIDAILKIKATRSTKHIPVVMATGVMTTSEDLREALEAGAIDYIRKPFDPTELTSRVNAALVLSDTILELNEKNKEIEELLEEEKVTAREKISQKEREISIQAIHTQEKVQVLSLLQRELKQLAEEVDLSDSKTYKTLLKKVQEGINEDNNDENFFLHFDKVHPDFFDLLKQRTSQLTTNELKLSAYLKIGMTNKEIAQISGVEIGTVKSNINRLKKKLNLSAEENVRRFMLYLKPI